MPYNIIIGLAGPYGAGCSSLCEDLSQIIKDLPSCTVEIIHVATTIENFFPNLSDDKKTQQPIKPPDRRKLLQEAGTELRQKDPNFIGYLAVGEIFNRGFEQESNKKFENTEIVFFIIDSIKNINDLETLKKIYSAEFYFLFVHANREVRWRRMKDYKSWDEEDRVSFEECDSIDRDEKAERPTVGDAGQQVQKLSSFADYYIVNNNENREKLYEEAKRFLDLLLGNGKNQPTLYERSMHLAFSASNRSYCLSKQVGAAIVDQRGDILSVGWNDVPKATGGLYTQEDTNDKRCYLVGDRRCINDTNKEERFNKLIDKLCTEFSEIERARVDNIVHASLFKQATEYCRAVHAEMEALLSLCRSTVRSCEGATMYVTTYPCHNCTKHILCSGISKVIYIEPYPKSLAEEFHSDAIVVDPVDEFAPNKLIFVPYRGVSPKRYHDFFEKLGERKDTEGKYIFKRKEEIVKKPRFYLELTDRLRTVEKVDPITVKELATLDRLNKLVNGNIGEGEQHGKDGHVGKQLDKGDS